MNFKYIRGYINEIIEDKYLNIRRKFISTYQKLRYGTSDEECWNVYRVIAKHNLKKLQYFRNMQRMSCPMTWTNEYFNKQIDEVIWAYDYILDDNKYNPSPDCGHFEAYEVIDGITRGGFIKDEACEKRWQEYHAKAKELEERKKKALIWFAENLETFWD